MCFHRRCFHRSCHSLCVSQKFEVMTEWQVYLGFPCLASSLNLFGYHSDVSELRLVLAAAFPFVEPSWYLGRGEKQRGQVILVRLLFPQLAFLLPFQAPASWRGSLILVQSSKTAQTKVGLDLTSALYKVSLLHIS